MEKTKKYKVTGTSHYMDNILSLKSENLDYKSSKKDLIDEGYENERIYQYDFLVVKFDIEPEPTNLYDPNAIKVLADGVHIGYIKAGSCKHLLNAIRDNKIVKIDGVIYGGKYKYIGYDEDADKYYYDKGEYDYGAELTITEL